MAGCVCVNLCLRACGWVSVVIAPPETTRDHHRPRQTATQDGVVQRNQRCEFAEVLGLPTTMVGSLVHVLKHAYHSHLDDFRCDFKYAIV